MAQPFHWINDATPEDRVRAMKIIARNNVIIAIGSVLGGCVLAALYVRNCNLEARIAELELQTHGDGDPDDTAGLQEYHQIRGLS